MRGTLSTRILTPTLPEEDEEDRSFEATGNESTADVTPLLSETFEALAAVEAMSSFRELRDVKQDLRQSFNLDDIKHETKEQKVVDETPPDIISLEKWKKDWEIFVKEKKKIKFDEVAIQVSLSLNCMQSSSF